MTIIDNILASVQKPARYTGGEFGEVIKNPNEVAILFAFCFPDKYDIGMSHLGMKILYSLINQRNDTYCERCFAPAEDLIVELKKHNYPLFTLETKSPLIDFDIIGYTLQYELSYTTILLMLKLSNIPYYSKDRDERFPLIIGGGPCAVNAEPIADFFDLFVIGDGEIVTNKLLDLYKSEKENGYNKNEFLKKACIIDGIYVPQFYDIKYFEDGKISEIVNEDFAPKQVKRQIISNLDTVFYPDTFIVPYTEIIHDRASVEIMRGCVRGCRFCQAGFIYRPLREKSIDTNNKSAKTLCENTGYEELSLLSLSTSDYSQLNELLEELLKWTEEKKTALSLPSLRVDNFSDEIREKISRFKKSGLTFAPEAGTQRLRNVINKNVTEEELFNTVSIAFEGGYNTLKLYFMTGLPTETFDDLDGIVKLAGNVVNIYYNNPNKQKFKSISLSVSASCFVPKPFTPFQWEPQDSIETMLEKQNYLRNLKRSNKINLSTGKPYIAFLEGVMARGDRRLSKVILTAFESGCYFDSWDEYFSFEKWHNAFEKCNISMEFYVNRRRGFDEILPYDMIDARINKDFLITEAKKAYSEATTPNCRESCQNCGVGCSDGIVGKVMDK